MTETRGPFTILMADDDDDDFLLMQTALNDAHLLNGLQRVSDGEQVLDYLRHRAPYDDLSRHPDPTLILLDLNMPRMDGREVLKELKNDPALQHIPVVVLTNSQAGEDVMASYKLGVNSFIRKPLSFESLTRVIRIMGHYWFETVVLPQPRRTARRP